MTARTDLAETTEAAERAIDAVMAPLAPQIAASVRNRAEEGKITHAVRRAILRDVDRLLSHAYPDRPGAASMLGTVILRQMAAVAAKPIAAEVERMERVLKDERVLLEMMKRGRTNR